jgi:hypothetical protein
VFSLALPDEWVLSELDDLVEIVPPGANGPLHISFMRRVRPGLVAEREAARLVLAVADGLGVSNAEVQELDLGNHRFARTEVAAGERHRPLFWDVAAHVWEQHALVASYSHDGTRLETRLAALEILGSIRAHA